MSDVATQTPIHDYVHLSEWNFDGPVTFYDGKIYFSLRILCDFLGVKAQMQLERIRNDDTLSRFLRQVPIKTRTGVRETWSIERRGIGWWIATMQRRIVREDIRAHLIEFQEALIDEADRRFFSESERNPLAALRAQIITLERRYAEQERYTRMLEDRITRLEERRDSKTSE